MRITRRSAVAALLAIPVVVVSDAPRAEACGQCGHELWGDGDIFEWRPAQGDDLFGDGHLVCQECSRGTPDERAAARCSDCGVNPADFFAQSPRLYWPSYWPDDPSHSYYWEGGYTEYGRCGHCAIARRQRLMGDAVPWTEQMAAASRIAGAMKTWGSYV